MGKKLIIAEKPSLAMKIVAGIGRMDKKDGYFENGDFIVTFAFGHLLGLKSIDEYLKREKTKWQLEELPFIPEKFEFILKEDSGIKKQFYIIKKLYTREDVTSVINAGDPDREGSVIILNIINKLVEETGKEKRIERIWLTATTPEFVRQALDKDNRKEECAYGNLYEEGLTRTYVDWLWGINFTRFVTLKAGSSFPVGRVLTPIVKFIYDRDRSIEQFKKEKYFEIEAVIRKNNEMVKGKIKNLRFTKEEIGKEKLEQLQSEKLIVESVETKNIKKAAPKLFSLDKLQNKMSKELKYSSAETLQIVQKLYEQGFVTYPRTNTEYLATAEKGSVQYILTMLAEKENIPLILKENKTIFDDTKIEGHTALIITNKIPEISILSEKEKNVYQSIKNRFIANFLDLDTIVKETKVTISIGKEYIELKGTSILEEGFLKYEKAKNETFLPYFIEGEILEGSLELVEKVTQPPAHVTEAELNTFLKNPFKKQEIEEQENDDEEYKAIINGCEIGTVATRASIIENAQKYEYIQKEKNAFHITEKGKVFINLLARLNINMEKKKTVEIGMLLKKVYRMETTSDYVVEYAAKEISEVIKQHKNDSIIEYNQNTSRGIGQCPNCGGNILKGKSNYYCDNYKEKNCQFKIWETISGKKLTENQIKQLLEKGRTSILKGFISKAGKKFDAALALQDGQVTFDFKKK